MQWLSRRQVPLSAWAPRGGRSTQLELPEGHGLLLLTDGLFEGHSGRGNERLGEDGLLELARHLRRCPVARSWTRSSAKRRRGHERTAGTPTT